MRFEDFYERGAAVRGLCEAFQTGAPVHATLLTGSWGIGKRTLANLCAQSLFCTSATRPCGVCPGCVRFIAATHPDAHRIPAQKRIGVGDVRALLSALHAAAYEGGFRTAIIEDAGTMTIEAQNALLKTLEEPPMKTVFLLTAASSSEVLPTIRSRCRIVQVRPMRQEQIKAALHERGVEKERVEMLSALSDGSIGRALQIHQDDTYWTLLGKVIDAMQSIRRASDLMSAVNAFKDDRAESGRVMDILESAISEGLRARLADRPLGENAWHTVIAGASPRALVHLLEAVASARRMLASNVSWQSVWERFLLTYSEEVTAWQS